MSDNKGFTLMEILIVNMVFAILILIAMPLYQDYSKKSRAAELPPLLKHIVDVQIAFSMDPERNGNYAAALATLNWTTSSGGTAGKYYSFGTSGVNDCDPGTAADPLPIGLGEAWAINDEEVLETWRSGCMTQDHKISTNAP